MRKSFFALFLSVLALCGCDKSNGVDGPDGPGATAGPMVITAAPLSPFTKVEYSLDGSSGALKQSWQADDEIFGAFAPSTLSSISDGIPWTKVSFKVDFVDPDTGTATLSQTTNPAAQFKEGDQFFMFYCPKKTVTDVGGPNPKLSLDLSFQSAYEKIPVSMTGQGKVKNNALTLTFSNPTAIIAIDGNLGNDLKEKYLTKVIVSGENLYCAGSIAIDNRVGFAPETKGDITREPFIRVPENGILEQPILIAAVPSTPADRSGNRTVSSFQKITILDDGGNRYEHSFDSSITLEAGKCVRVQETFELRQP